MRKTHLLQKAAGGLGNAEGLYFLRCSEKTGEASSTGGELFSSVAASKFALVEHAA